MNHLQTITSNVSLSEKNNHSIIHRKKPIWTLKLFGKYKILKDRYLRSIQFQCANFFILHFKITIAVMKTFFENIKSKPLFTSSSFSLLLFQIFHYGLFSLRILLPRPLLCSFSVVFELVALTSKLDNFHVHPWEIWWKRFWFFHSFPLCQDQHTLRKKKYRINLGFRLWWYVIEVILRW